MPSAIRVPLTHCPVVAAAEDAPGVRGVANAVDAILVPTQNGHLSSTQEISHSYGFVHFTLNQDMVTLADCA